MKKIIMISVAVIVALGASVLGLFYFIGKKHANCMNGEGQPAIEACTFMIKYYPAPLQKVTYLLKRSTQYTKADNLKAGAADMEEILSLNEKEKLNMPEDILARVYNYLASEYGSSGDMEKGIKYAELAMKAGSEDPAVYINLSSVYIKEKRYQEAVESLKTAQKLDPSNSATYFNYALIALAVPDYPLGYSYLKKSESYRNAETAQGKLPAIKEVRFHKTMALACMGLKRYGEAEEVLTRLMESGQDCPECPDLLAQNARMAKLEAAPARKTGKTKKRRTN